MRWATVLAAGLMLGLTACGGASREEFNANAQQAVERLYLMLDQYPADTELEKVTQGWGACGGLYDSVAVVVSAELAPSDELGDHIQSQVVPFAKSQGWSVRDRGTDDEVAIAFDDVESELIIANFAQTGRHRASISSTRCLDRYPGFDLQSGRLPEDITEFVRDRRPVDELPVLDPDRGPVEINTTGEIDRPFDLSESESPAPTMDS